MSYYPPTGIVADLELAGGYTPADPAAADLTFPRSDVYTGRSIPLVGITAPGFGTPGVLERARRVGVAGVEAGDAGAPTVWNWRQYVAPGGTHGAVPDPLVFNWRRFVEPGPLDTGVIGSLVVPPMPYAWGMGWEAGAVGTPAVSPQIAYTFGIGPGLVGYPDAAIRMAQGWDSSLLGVPGVALGQVYVLPASLPGGAMGDAAVADRRQTVRPAALVEAGIFGDTRAFNLQQVIGLEGFDASFVSAYLTTANRNREVAPYGWAPQAFGPHLGVDNKARAVSPLGIDSLTWGETGAGGYIQTVSARPVDDGHFGTPLTRTLAVALTPAPLTGEMGQPVVDFRVRSIQAVGGDDGGLFGTLTTWFYRRGLSAEGNDEASYGSPRVDSSIRAVDVDPVLAGAVSPPVVGLRVRTIAPPSTTLTYLWQQFGGAQVQDGLQTVAAPGLPAGDLGLPATARNERLVAPAGITSTLGVPDAQLYRRVLGVRPAAEQTQWGAAQISNTSQTVVQAEGLPVNTAGVPSVDNRNRTVRTYGVDSFKVPVGASVENRARLVVPAGADMLLPGDALVALRVRTVRPESFAEADVPVWAGVLNTRQYVEPSGIPRLYAGVPTVIDTTQRVGPAGGNVTAVFGQTTAAPRVRAVVLWAIGPGNTAQPDVQLYTRYVTVTGFAHATGVPTVETHRNILSPWGRDTAVFGTGAAANATPQVFAASWMSDEFGRPAAGLFTRYVAPDPAVSPAFGSATVGDRLRVVRPGGVETLRWGKQEVAFDAPQIPPQQTVQVPGIEPVDLPMPDLLYRGAMAEGWDSVQFGRPATRTNVVSNVTIQLNEVDQMGEPSLNSPQFIVLKGMGAPALPEPRITPTTIWIHEPPEPLQAKPLSLVDECYDSEYPTFGNTAVTLRNQTVAVNHVNSNATAPVFGDAEVSLRVRRLGVTGITPGRFGFPRLPTGGLVQPYWGRLTEEWVAGGDVDTARYGEASVGFPPTLTQALAFTGADLLQPGVPEVSLWVRTLLPGGIYSTIFTGDNVVHPPVRLGVGGIAPAAAGQPWASFKVRQVLATGGDMSGFDYALGTGEFFPMKVRHRNRMSPAGILALPPASPTVTLPDLGAVATLGDTSTFGRPRLGACSC